jgi:endonuclease I
MKMMTALLTTLFCLSAFAVSSNNDVERYYKGSFDSLNTGRLTNDQLKSALYNILSKPHKALGYKSAKKVMFNKLHWKKDNRGKGYVLDLYCGKVVTHTNTNRIPQSSVINAEHTWPQSKFSREFAKSIQKSDLHHLFPVNSNTNSMRGNFDFAEVTVLHSDHHQCGESKMGLASYGGSSRNFFEPPNSHKGNVARALFYFAIRYKMRISSIQEHFLREWHVQDPVDHDEMRRNDLVQNAQRNRNPFVDFPNLVDSIDNF